MRLNCELPVGLSGRGRADSTTTARAAATSDPDAFGAYGITGSDPGGFILAAKEL